ncbi:MAG TPA: Uma2 family endonuclease [Polyangiaceae bacterium]|nr:Uma2 family endonuclease [Polyangiaceae bacterium]
MQQSPWANTWVPPRSAGRSVTLEEWADLAEDEAGEWVDGQLTEEEMPDPVHELAATWLTTLFRIWLRGRGGFVFGSEVKLRVTPTRGRKADAMVILPGSPAPPRRGLLTTPPDILVEIVTPTPRDERRDRIEKMLEYETLGVPYYWLLDPALGTLEIFELGPESSTVEGEPRRKYTRAIAATEGRIDPVPGCPGLALDLDELWADLERLVPEMYP